MSFLNPIFFWSFISLIPLGLIYLLRVRPRRKPSTAYFLWEDIFKERRPNRLLQKLRDVWSLLLMALAFSAVCLALTRPEVSDDDRKDVLLLIDNSASMNTVEGTETRLETAQKAAVGILRSFNGTQRAAVANVAHQIEYKSHLSDNPRELIDAVQSIQPTDYELRVDQLSENRFSNEQGSVVGSDTPTDSSEDSEEAGASAEGATSEWLDGQRVVLISDGCFDTSRLAGRIELMKIGNPVDNVGLVSADLRRLPSATDRLGLYFQLHSTHAAQVNLDLLVYQGEDESNLFRLIPLEVQPGLNDPMIFNLENAAAGAWKIKLDVDDGLANDNVAQLAVPPTQPINVQVTSENRFFFENSVLAFSSGAGLLQLVEENPDIVISQGAWEEQDRAIVFQPSGESKWWSNVGEELEAVAPKILVEDHPVLRHIDVSSMSFDGAVQLSVPDKAQVLVSSDEDVPLIFRVSENGKTAIIVNLDPVASNFYFSAWFPVLVHGSATHLAGREDQLLATYRPGDSIPIAGGRDGRLTQVTQPDNSELETDEGELNPIQQVGYYQLKNEAGEWTVASSMLSRQETNIDNAKASDTSAPINRGWPLSSLLTVAAVIALGLESILYHRRKVG